MKNLLNKEKYFCVHYKFKKNGEVFESKEYLRDNTPPVKEIFESTREAIYLEKHVYVLSIRELSREEYFKEIFGNNK